MKLDRTLLPMNPEDGEGEGAPRFCSLQQGAREFAARTAGKLLFVGDRKSFSALAFSPRLPRAVCVVLDSADALPLFAMPDGVGGVFAAGGADTLRGARAYAALNRLSCVLAPCGATVEGVFGSEGKVRFSGREDSYPLATGQLILDKALLQPTLADGFARLLLARLAVFELRAKAMLGLGQEDRIAEDMFPLLTCLEGEPTDEDILLANVRLAALEAGGEPAGEGHVLAALFGGEQPRLRAFCALFALYSAFFTHGKPRKYTVPDYGQRAEYAGTRAGTPPTAEEYARRSMLLERRRGEIVRELNLLGRRRADWLRMSARLSGKYFSSGGEAPVLKTLPEHAPSGLSALIRDFGLMEW